VPSPTMRPTGKRSSQVPPAWGVDVGVAIRSWVREYDKRYHRSLELYADHFG